MAEIPRNNTGLSGKYFVAAELYRRGRSVNNSGDTVLNYVCFYSSFVPLFGRVCADVDFS